MLAHLLAENLLMSTIPYWGRNPSTRLPNMQLEERAFMFFKLSSLFDVFVRLNL